MWYAAIAVLPEFLETEPLILGVLAVLLDMEHCNCMSSLLCDH